VSLRPGLEERDKSRLRPGFDLWKVEPVTLRFTRNLFLELLRKITKNCIQNAGRDLRPGPVALTV
jgi:hypothetical protein